MKQLCFKKARVAGMPLWLYLVCLVLTLGCMYAGVIPQKMIPALLVLMVLGEGLAALGNTIPVIKTYFGGSVMCVVGGALVTYAGLIPEQTHETLSVFINDSGFLVFYIAALITGSLFNVDRGLLLRATVKILPVAMCSVAVGIGLSGLFGVLLGDGFWEGILYIGVPMTSGGMTAGAVPLSTIYASQLGIPAADVLNRMAPATVLGNCIALIFAGLLKDSGKKHPTWTGNGHLVNDGKPVRKMPVTPLELDKLVAGFFLSVAFYTLGSLLHHFFPVVPIYAFMILAVVIVKCGGFFPEEVEDAARQWGRFIIRVWSMAALFSIGITLIDLHVILANLTPAFLITAFVVELVITLTAAFLGKAVGFYPVESAIAAGMCTTNMGGSGNVAVLSGANRMELLPFAQIVTRSCGALMLTLGGILVRFFG